MEQHTARSREQAPAWFPAALMVSGACLLIAGIALRVAGPVVPDSVTTPDAVAHFARHTADQSSAALVAGAGLAWIGLRGITSSATTPAMVRRLNLLALALAGLCLLLALPVGAAAAAVCCVAALVYHRRRSSRLRDEALS